MEREYNNINIQEKMKEFWSGSCYAYCIGYMQGLRTLKELTKFVLDSWYKGYIDDNCYVHSPHKMMGAKDVRITKINEITDIPQEPTIIEMKCPSGGSHFIVGKRTSNNVVDLVFDPAGVSNSWKAQNFVSYRSFV